MLPPDPSGEPMCEKCRHLENEIKRYRRLVVMGLDALTVERINSLIQELQQRKETMPH
jgi:hypothetical protein